MRKALTATFPILLAILVATGCGSSNGSNSGNINGTWTANLVNTDNSPAFNFTTDFTQSSGSAITVTNLKFNSGGNCFTGTTTETGTFGLSGNFNGSVTGTFGLNVSEGATGGNALALKGAVTGNTITGTWTLTGTSGCSGNGAFTVNKS